MSVETLEALINLPYFKFKFKSLKWRLVYLFGTFKDKLAFMLNDLGRIAPLKHQFKNVYAQYQAAEISS